MNPRDYVTGHRGRRGAALLCSLFSAVFALLSCQTLNSAPAPVPAAKGKAAPPPKRVSPVPPITAEADQIFKTHKDSRGDVGPEGVEACEFLERAIAKAKKEDFTSYEIAQLWQAYCRKAWILFRDDLLVKGYEEMMKANPSIATAEMTAARLTPHYRALKELKTFPLKEKDIKFGQTLESMGVADTNVVHLKDFGWNPTNVTAAFQQLINDPSVTTIVLDKMPTPWYIDSVMFGTKVNGKRILFKSGVEILRCPDRLRHVIGSKSAAMFSIRGAKNLIIESDAEKPEDVHIGFYKNYEERAKVNKNEGASGFSIGGADKGRTDTSINVVLRNFRVADTEQDGLAVGGLWRPPEEIYVENVILDSNYRQGTSPCAYYSLYFKNCQFTNTRGGPPTAGVDVEPYDDFLCTAFLYFFDCTFRNNSSGLLYATSTRDPILCYVGRCRFEPTRGSHIDICARPTRYIRADRRPYTKFIIENSVFESTGSSFHFEPCPIFDMTVRDCVIRDVRTPEAKAQAKHGPAPIRLGLSRNFGTPDLSRNLLPAIRFENVKIEGFEDSEPLSVSDEVGMLNVKGVFKGKVDWNGKKVDLSVCDYDAPDLHEPKTEFVELKSLQTPKKVLKAGEDMPASNCKLCFMGAWWLRHPNPSYYFWAEKGREVSFDFEVTHPQYAKKFPTNEMFVVSTSGRNVPIGSATKGTQRLAYVAPETGWHRFSPGLVLDPNPETGSSVEWYVSNIKGAYFAWQADTVSDSFAKFFLRDKEQPYTGYFEVPAGGQTCRLRVSFGGFELYNPAGELVDRVAKSDYVGRHYFEIKPSSDKAEIWSFRSLTGKEGGNTRGLRFYQPLNGIWADSPESLPCVYSEHFVPENKAQAAAQAEAVFVPLDRTALGAADLKVLDAAVAARKTFAAKKEYAALARGQEEKVAKMRAGKMNDDTQHQIDDITGHIEILKRVARMEEIAAAETPEVAETAAFCQAFAGLLVGEKDMAKARANADLAPALKALGLGWEEGVLEYQKPADLMALKDKLLEKLGK